MNNLANIIQLLPDNIANQIAAGEVIQRPASAVKELLENAIDAGADDIRLLVLDAGKSLIQVSDNGKGMSETDARLCFERHATSKIRQIEDLFQIRTMGFRGEALASVAAVAQVELRSRRPEDEAGTRIEIENSVVLLQEPVAMSPGTVISMKNLFFNIPARRNFLKSHAAEMRHIVEEFMRIALAFPEIRFSLSSNGQTLYQLEAGSLKQRIVQLLGSNYASRLVTVQEKTDYLNIYGFVGKPDTARKTRGDQYFFVNQRFIRSAYLNHAVMSAFQDLIPADAFPLYVLFIDLDPAQLDINVHPTKQEIKFEDEKIVYAFVQAAVKHALAQFSITPTLEFDLDPEIQRLDAVSKPFTSDQQEAVFSSRLFRNFTEKNQAHFLERSGESTLPPWKQFTEREADTAGQSSFVSLLDRLRVPEEEIPSSSGPLIPAGTADRPAADWKAQQVEGTYILSATGRGFILVQQQLAHERILYERYRAAAAGKPMATQQLLFPVTLQLPAADALILEELLPDLKRLGYAIEPFGQHSFILRGTPAGIEEGKEKNNIESLIDQYKHFASELKCSSQEKLLRSLARQQAIRPGQLLEQSEMQQLLQDLFRCEVPNLSPGGQPSYIDFGKEYLEQLFRRQ